MICAETGPQALTKPAAAAIGALTENGVMHYGLLSVVPVVIVIVLAVATRRAFESILAGTLAASLILYHTHFITGWTNAFLEVAASRLLPLKPGTTVILVFDTDTDNSQILKTNIEFISSRTNILKVLCVTQVKNLEDEILRSCTIKHIRDLTNSKSDKEYKADLIHITNLAKRLVECGFKPEMFWAREPRDAFSDIKNDAQYIWIKQSLNDGKKT